jgi:TraX protein
MKSSPATALPANASALLPRLVIPDGSLEALKWLALILMTLDHVNKYLLQGSVPAMFNAGRIAMPLFAIVLAHNLARPGTRKAGSYRRVMKRLAITGAVTTLPFVALGGLGWGWWPLNIMFTFLVAAGAMALIDSRQTFKRIAAFGLLLIGGLFVEFWWPALAILMATWSYTKRPNWPAVVLGLAGLASLHWINHSDWAWAALPLVLLAGCINLPLPKLWWFFYVFYPAHLAVIWLVRGIALP